jgi:hypothetical protein
MAIKATRHTARTQAAADAIESGSSEGAYPKAMYKRNPKDPNGYDVKRVESPADEAKLDSKVWKNSPEELGI